MRVLRPILFSTLLAASIATGAAPTSAPAAGLARATFAGGCFWCMEPPFEKLVGVVSVTSGYTGGNVVDPTYEQVSSGRTGHAEAVEVVYDPKRVDYAALLDVYWRNVDPTVANRQFCDHGTQYRTAIFVHDAEQRRLAEASKAAHAASPRFAGKPIVTPIADARAFYAAEGYHQDYYRRNPTRYNVYRWNCGRDRRLEEIWGAPAEH
jgi:peptide-methionine (S)-S-oxide reductase